jgi:hypothetical protein
MEIPKNQTVDPGNSHHVDGIEATKLRFCDAVSQGT